MPELENIENRSIVRVPNFTKYYVTNIHGGETTQDFRYELMNEKVYDADDEEWNYVSDALVILSPVAAKRLLLKLSEDIQSYEEEHGEIETKFEEDLLY